MRVNLFYCKLQRTLIMNMFTYLIPAGEHMIVHRIIGLSCYIKYFYQGILTFEYIVMNVVVSRAEVPL